MSAAASLVFGEIRYGNFPRFLKQTGEVQLNSDGDSPKINSPVPCLNCTTAHVLASAIIRHNITKSGIDAVGLGWLSGA